MNTLLSSGSGLTQLNPCINLTQLVSLFKIISFGKHLIGKKKKNLLVRDFFFQVF